ncbi:hypothetical protein NDN08_002679 [Rhodosorus marinus]|uniref:Protein kinase domain-containing protein n=1 Tax=Rhodosorus marinus TaxID=101924 RepID=A0AAV8UUK2_9RHOD|nr:hypothetical protein NDN08_002679 [Rhodosorus marinus]
MGEPANEGDGYLHELPIVEGLVKRLRAAFGRRNYWCRTFGASVELYNRRGDVVPRLRVVAPDVEIGVDNKTLILDGLALEVHDVAMMSDWRYWLVSANEHGLSKYYTLQREISRGQYSKVFLASTVSTNDIVAVRVLDLKGSKAKEAAILLPREVHFLRFVRSPFVVRAYDFFVDKDSAQIVAELMDYGSIRSMMMKEGVQSLTERQVAWIMFHVLSALRDLHGLGVIHRNVSLYSVLMQYNPGDPETPIVKLADLGLACSSTNTRAEDFVVGALVNIAPEVFRKQKCGKEVDLWASGLLCYHLLAGHHPLEKMDSAQIAFELGTQGGRISYKEQEWAGVSRAGRDFTEALLEFEQAKRMNTEAALAHSFLAEPAQRFNHTIPAPAIGPENLNLQAGTLFGQSSRHS